MVMALASAQPAARDMYLFDTFSGMTEPSESDRDFRGEPPAAGQEFDEWNKRYTAGMQEVRNNLRTTGYPEEKLHLVGGDVLNTLPGSAPERIALLRLDTDWYHSTRHELETLYPRLVSGGVLIIDDYGHWEGARGATEEFFAGRPDAPLLNRVDYTARLGIKP